MQLEILVCVWLLPHPFDQVRDEIFRKVNLYQLPMLKSVDFFVYDRFEGIRMNCKVRSRIVYEVILLSHGRELNLNPNYILRLFSVHFLQVPMPRRWPSPFVDTAGVATVCHFVVVIVARALGL